MKIGAFIVEYLREFEAEFKKALDLNQALGAGGGSFYEKTKGRKSLNTAPLMNTRLKNFRLLILQF
jgi:hypothetical protein